jgi:hypothetical protein
MYSSSIKTDSSIQDVLVTRLKLGILSSWTHPPCNLCHTFRCAFDSSPAPFRCVPFRVDNLLTIVPTYGSQWLWQDIVIYAGKFSQSPCYPPGRLIDSSTSLNKANPLPPIPLKPHSPSKFPCPSQRRLPLPDTGLSTILLWRFTSASFLWTHQATENYDTMRSTLSSNHNI